MSGIDLIRAERRRQRSRGGEGYSASWDDAHTRGEIARAAAIYALPPDVRERNQDFVRLLNPSDWYLKLNSADRVRELVKAGALIAAEIDRLLRLQEGEKEA